MPKEIEEKLKKSATKMARSGKLRTMGKYKSIEEAKNAYVYGTLNKLKEKYGVK